MRGKFNVVSVGKLDPDHIATYTHRDITVDLEATRRVGTKEETTHYMTITVPLTEQEHKEIMPYVR